MKYVVGLFVLVVGLGLFSIFTGVVGTVATVANAPGKVLQKTVDADNIIHKYEWFFDARASVTSRVSQIKQFHGFLKGETDKAEMRRLRMEMAAMQQSCRELVTKYNENSKKLNVRIFKDWSMPSSLNLNNCEVL